MCDRACSVLLLLAIRHLLLPVSCELVAHLHLESIGDRRFSGPCVGKHPIRTLTHGEPSPVGLPVAVLEEIHTAAHNASRIDRPWSNFSRPITRTCRAQGFGGCRALAAGLWHVEVTAVISSH
jgi:hypothetical protein